MRNRRGTTPTGQTSTRAGTALAYVFVGLSDLVAGLFAVAAYGISPQGDWDRGAIDAADLAASAGVAVTLATLVAQALLVRPARRVAWPWLAVPVIALALLLARRYGLEQYLTDAPR
ncbi:hypothetical protein [Goodfellowiella coeruleoviolacea]|uniref:Uncharacterized protein n=1 Tax=Goodfellowiella coeruleoviolacea TaxID=334858 RepID=A0AAE3G8F4_9PSEU|nr:hypothetical protein [Goodfellowiella coeruleoviolacea]MCP2163188.1 hypothetical protein [Goodfellowiella coeruleoviolacea]